MTPRTFGLTGFSMRLESSMMAEGCGAAILVILFWMSWTPMQSKHPAV
jgi:hypothetical protein